jgi:hypothetical protein
LIGENILGLLKFSPQVGQLLFERLLFGIFGLLQADKSVVQVQDLVGLALEFLLQIARNVPFVGRKSFILARELLSEQLEFIAFLLIPEVWQQPSYRKQRVFISQ